MLDDLFTVDSQSGNQSSEVELPDDVAQWPQIIQSVVMSASPVLSQYPGQLIIDAFDEDRLFAKGSYVVDMNGEQITIPIIVRAKQLLPIDIFIHNGKWYPMDAEYLETLSTSASMGTDLVKPSDVPATANGDMRKGIVPPGHKPYTGSTAPMVVTASARFPEITAKIEKLIEKSAYIKKALHQNKTAYNMFDKMLSADASQIKTAGINPMANDCVIVSLGQGDFSIKTARSAFEFDYAECNGDSLADYIKEAGIDGQRVLAELAENGIAYSWAEASGSGLQKIGSVKKIGSFTGFNADTLKPTGFTVLAMVKRIDGAKTDEVLSVGDDDSTIKQKEVIGVPSDDSKSNVEVKEIESAPIGDKISIPLPDEGAADELQALEPIDVKGKSQIGGVDMISGETDTGDKTVIIIVPSGKIDSPIKADILPKELGIAKSATAWYVPSGYPVFSLPKTASKLVSSEDELVYKQNLSQKIAGKIEYAHVWKMGAGSNAVKLGNANPVILSDTETILCLKKLGQRVLSDELMAKISSKPIKFTTLIQDTNKVAKFNVKIGDSISLLKVAASLDDEQTIDQVLSLNYINPDNMSEFVNSIPKLQEAENGLAKLLVSTRLGNEMIDEPAVKSALKEVHNVVKTLSRHS